MTNMYTGPDGFQRDLDAEKLQFPRWTFVPVEGGLAGPPAPGIRPSYLAKAYFNGTTRNVTAEGDSREEALANLLDDMRSKIMPSDR